MAKPVIVVPTTAEVRYVLVDDEGNEILPRLNEPLPLIDCTTSPPCGHCWYCKARVAK